MSLTRRTILGVGAAESPAVAGRPRPGAAGRRPARRRRPAMCSRRPGRFTGTSLLVDPNRGLVLVLLTNRAHPNWTWANPDQHRVAVANLLADVVR